MIMNSPSFYEQGLWKNPKVDETTVGSLNDETRGMLQWEERTFFLYFPEDVDSKTIRNTGIYIPLCTASYHMGLESPLAPL